VRLEIDPGFTRTEPLPDAGFGALRTSAGNLPLRSMDVRASITAAIAGIEIAQEFANSFDLPLEATYTFPLPDRAAVTALRMEADGRVVDGVLTERAAARRDYDAAIAAGQRAAMAEEDRPNVFTMSVGNILPGERVTIRLSLTQPLAAQDGEITFRFPLVVAPRYIPGVPLPGMSAGTGVAPDTDAVPDASRISPPVLLPGFPSPVRLSLLADIDPAGLQLAQIRSSLHAVAQEGDAAGHAIVRVTPGERLDRDFILRLAVADAAQVTGSLVLCPDDQAQPRQAQTSQAQPPQAADGGGRLGAGAFLLTLVPPVLAPGSPARDVVIVLDRSGSMAGWKMVAARRAAARIVDTLGDGDRFAALCFDNDISEPPELAGALAAGTDRNRFRAVQFLAGVTARGGTSMLPALEHAADLLTADGGDAAARHRALVLVTDGQVGNEDQILSQLGPRLAGARVHVVGIDQAVNAGFLGRLAAIGRGRCELVESQDRLDEAAARIHQRIAAPLITGLTMQAEQLTIVAGTVAPARLPDLFAGAPVTISGRFDGPWSPDATITVRGRSADGTPYEQVLTGTAASDGAVTAIWARAYVRELEDSYACLAPAGSADLQRLESQIVAASLRFSVLCRFTAFLAVDTRIVAEEGAPHRVTQPVELPAGWDRPAAPAMPVAMSASGAAGHRLLLAGGPAPSQPPAPGVAGWAPAAATAPGWAAPAAEAAAMPAAVPAWATRQIADELDWLAAPTEQAGPELARSLSDLGSRLMALATWLAGDGVESVRLAGLLELAARLQVCEGQDRPDRAGAGPEPSLSGLRDDARRILREFLDDAEHDDHRSSRRSRGGAPFWKRPRRAP
jgi:Ca-activated chloride channel family protein